MDDYIKREDALLLVKDVAESCVVDRSEVLFDVHIGLVNIPAADVRENVRVEWENICDYDNVRGINYNRWMCSNCGYVRKRGWEHTSDGNKPRAKFCENCGADMRKENT